LAQRVLSANTNFALLAFAIEFIIDVVMAGLGSQLRLGSGKDLDARDKPAQKFNAIENT
jgi:hypothetical protein